MEFKLSYNLISDRYESKPVKISLFARLFPSIYFYSRIFYLLYRGHKIALKGEYDTDAWIYSSFWTLDIIERSGIKVYIEGVDNIVNYKGPCVFVGNHMSTAETFLLPSIIAPIKPFTYILKESLMDVPMLKHMLKATDPIVVTRNNPREDFKIVMEKGGEKLANGISVTVFPQTTRTPIFDEKQFNSMGVKLAKKAGVPILPIALKTDAWSNGKLIKDLGKIRPELDIHLVFGKPIHISGRGDEEHQMAIDFIKSHLKNWGCSVVE
ncbi:MAG: 1-acyl-sn-glycerol-3-phosphate acyltransferase [Calditerrivibrio sp.]|nr:1-acyl-sn-glycerol-3-phosphate acyltransferase [Calditerrivibrio sp.]MCA1932115.1 1-acyl-sn-glycerol-3-phosphate acyltransferase [Calditerrivibrio sp.]